MRTSVLKFRFPKDAERSGFIRAREGLIETYKGKAITLRPGIDGYRVFAYGENDHYASDVVSLILWFTGFRQVGLYNHFLEPERFGRAMRLARASIDARGEGLNEKEAIHC